MFLCVCVSGFWLIFFFGYDSIKVSRCFWFFVVLMRNDLDLDYLFLFEIWVIDFLIS